MTPTQQVLFWAKVEQSDGCWEWQGARMGKGYGHVRVDRAYLAVHRVAWEIAHGPVPGGMLVLHHCDNPPCVRPDHLWLGTQRDNVRDMWRKGRNAAHAYGTDRPTAGERNAQAKLTWRQVVEIRRLYATGDTTQERLAKRFGVAKTTVSQIVRGVTWRLGTPG